MKQKSERDSTANPLLLLVTGLCPLLIPSFTLQNGLILGLGVCLHALLLAATIPPLAKLVGESLRFHLALTISAVITVIYSLTVRLVFPAEVPSLSPFIAFIALNCFSLSVMEGSLRQQSLEKFPEYARSAIVLFLTLIVFASLRELLGSGILTLYRTETAQAILDLRLLIRFPLRIALLPSGAFLLLGYGIAAYRLRNKRKKGALL